MRRNIFAFVGDGRFNAVVRRRVMLFPGGSGRSGGKNGGVMLFHPERQGELREAR